MSQTIANNGFGTLGWKLRTAVKGRNVVAAGESLDSYGLANKVCASKNQDMELFIS
jgi:hypothetical protein